MQGFFSVRIGFQIADLAQYPRLNLSQDNLQILEKLIILHDFKSL